MSCRKTCKCDECEMCWKTKMLVRDDRWNTSTWPNQIEIDGFKCGATGRYALDVKQLKKSSLDDDEILYSRNKELTKSIFSQFGVVIK